MLKDIMDNPTWQMQDHATLKLIPKRDNSAFGAGTRALCTGLPYRDFIATRNDTQFEDEMHDRGLGIRCNHLRFTFKLERKQEEYPALI